ncbi:MAG TPA: hypothetical protein V6C58_08985 [Allocoleopsis sp.]
MARKAKEKLQCPKCGGYNTTKHGMNMSGSPLIGCKDCKKQTVPQKTPLTELKCDYCGKQGVNYRSPATLCKGCYYKRDRDKTKLNKELIESIMRNPNFLVAHPDINLDEFTMYLYVLKFRQKRNIDLNENTLLKYFNAYQKFIQNLSNDKIKETTGNLS